MRQNLNNSVTKNVNSEKTTESRDCDCLRDSANRKPGSSVRGLKVRYKIVIMLVGLRNRETGGDTDSNTIDYIKCFVSSLVIQLTINICRL